ncbi:MAG: glutathione S-transferase family protein, partial [Rhodospirillaceae bacterium]|nr:glutathione S-transferase family protein [Rhodospirillaceae bacterium]
GAKYDPGLAERGRCDFALRADILSTVLGDRDFLLGANFSGADILVGHSCFMARFMDLLADFPVLAAYYDRLRQRPAHQRAYGG